MAFSLFSLLFLAHGWYPIVPFQQHLLITNKCKTHETPYHLKPGGTRFASHYTELTRYLRTVLCCVKMVEIGKYDLMSSQAVYIDVLNFPFIFFYCMPQVAYIHEAWILFNLMLLTTWNFETCNDEVLAPNPALTLHLSMKYTNSDTQ